MNGTNGNEPGYPEKALVPYPVILAATKGDPDAMKIVLQHFSGYIARLSMRKLYDERGNVYFGVDHDIRERLQRGNILAAFFDLQIAQLVQNPGKVGHPDRNTLIEKPIGNAGGKERLSCAHISPKQKAKVFCLDLLPVIHIALSHLDIGGILCYPKVPVQQMRVLNALLSEFCDLHQALQAAVFLLQHVYHSLQTVIAIIGVHAMMVVDISLCILPCPAENGRQMVLVGLTAGSHVLGKTVNPGRVVPRELLFQRLILRIRQKHIAIQTIPMAGRAILSFYLFICYFSICSFLFCISL